MARVLPAHDTTDLKTPGRTEYKAVSPEAERFGQELKKSRQGEGLTQVNIATELGVSQQAVATWERGIYLPLPHQLFRIEELFRLPRGALSQWLGYLPLPTNTTVKTATSAAILSDPHLSQGSRKKVLDLYLKLRDG